MMDLDHLLNIHDSLVDDLKFMVKSKVRLKILMSIIHNSRAMKEVKEEHDFSFPSVSNNMKQLLDRNMVMKVDDKYIISQLGFLKLYILSDFLKLISVTNQYEELWLNHDIEGIPDILLENMGFLKNSELVKAEHTDIYRAHNNFLDFLRQSKEIYGVAPISHPDYLKVFEAVLKGNARVTLIFTKEILKKVLESVDLKSLSKVISNNDLEIRLYDEEIPIAFTVTDTFMSLGLFYCDGIYDQNRDLVSTNENAIKWAKTLFDYYYQKSDTFNIKNLAKLTF